jgi:hypothetical protein
LLLWDRCDGALQVVGSTPSSTVVRAVASAPTRPISWDLCCEFRERLIAFLRDEDPDAFPGADAVPARSSSDRADIDDQ